MDIKVALAIPSELVFLSSMSSAVHFRYKPRWDCTGRFVQSSARTFLFTGAIAVDGVTVDNGPVGRGSGPPSARLK